MSELVPLIQQIWPFISFLIGACFALFLQWLSSRLAYRREQRREYWIRKLNSYQDFHQNTMQLLILLESRIKVPETHFWNSITLARKAAFDAAFYDLRHPKRTERMGQITEWLIRDYQESSGGQSDLAGLRKEIDDIQADFLREEGLATT